MADERDRGADIPPCLRSVCAAIAPVDPRWGAQARGLHTQLTKPPGSLGRLEALGARLCGIQARVPPRADPARVVVFAGDHGVAATQEVSPYPCEVTGQMVANFVAGGAAINTLARAAGADLWVVEVGVAHPIASLPPCPRFHRRNVAPGTHDITRGPAMDLDTFDAALRVGLSIAAACVRDGVRVVAIGEMGIGNTTVAAAVTSSLLGVAPESVTGRGTGATGDIHRRKLAAVHQAVQINDAHRQSAAEVLRRVGGLELAALCAFTLACARHRITVVLDGFIATAAATVAVAICPATRDVLVAGHRSTEPGHTVLLQHLDLAPLLELDLRLGEGSGAALALPLVAAATAVMREMATFEEAGVVDRGAP